MVVNLRDGQNTRPTSNLWKVMSSNKLWLLIRVIALSALLLSMYFTIPVVTIPRFKSLYFMSGTTPSFSKSTSLSVDPLLVGEPPLTCSYWYSTCPKDHWPRALRNGEDYWGSMPYNCSKHLDTPLPPNGSYHVFNISICQNSSVMVLRVKHLEGFVDSPPNWRFGTGPDFISAQFVGPELRWFSFQNIDRSNVYEAVVDDLLPGCYTFDITVIHTPYLEEETRKNPEEWPFLYTRNLLVADQLVWDAANSFPQNRKSSTTATFMTGRWLQVKDTHGNVSVTTSKETPNCPRAHRCRHWDQFMFTKSNIRTEKEPSPVKKCLNAAKHEGTQITPMRILMMGDSQTRNTFNALLGIIWPNKEDVGAVKEKKAPKDTQCFGDEDTGLELCYLWNPKDISQERVASQVESYNRILINAGQHFLSHPASSMDGWEQHVEAGLRKLASYINETNAMKGKDSIVWLETYPFPGMNSNYSVTYKDRRQLPFILEANKRTQTIMMDAAISTIQVHDVLYPFQDCTIDSAHYPLLLNEVVAEHKILPWICDGLFPSI